LLLLPPLTFAIFAVVTIIIAVAIAAVLTHFYCYLRLKSCQSAQEGRWAGRSKETIRFDKI
jgi:hypothetical protein